MSSFVEADWLASALSAVWFDISTVPILLEGMRLVYGIDGAQAHLPSLHSNPGHRGIAWFWKILGSAAKDVPLLESVVEYPSDGTSIA